MENMEKPDDSKIQWCRGVRTGSVWPIFKSMFPNAPRSAIDNRLDACHAGVTIRIDKIDIALNEDTIPIRGNGRELDYDENKKPDK